MLYSHSIYSTLQNNATSTLRPVSIRDEMQMPHHPDPGLSVDI